jgi:DNA-binding NarL/FixJ family response regulator
MANRPDAVVMDVQLGDVSGIDLTAQLTALPTPPRVVVLTVKTHIRNIAAKLGTRSMAEAVAMALQAGLRPEFKAPGTRPSCPGPGRRSGRSRSRPAPGTG